MSALTPKADTCSALAHVRFGSKADMRSARADVRFTPNNDHESEIPQKPWAERPAPIYGVFDQVEALRLSSVGIRVDMRGRGYRSTVPLLAPASVHPAMTAWYFCRVAPNLQSGRAHPR